MIEQHGSHTCRHCGEEMTWTVFLRDEKREEIPVRAKCPYCGTEHRWIEWAGK